MYYLQPNLLNPLSGLNQLFREINNAPRTSSVPKINILRNNDSIAVTAEIPGVDPKEINVTVQGDKVTISGEMAKRVKKEGDVYHRCERPSGKFNRELTLPFRVDSDNISAESKNGILNIFLRAAEDAKPKKISVAVA